MAFKLELEKKSLKLVSIEKVFNLKLISLGFKTK